MQRAIGVVMLWLLPGMAAAAAAEILELTGFQLIDGTGAAPRPVARMLIADTVIVAIDAEGAVPPRRPGQRWTSIDLAGHWVMPGLVDTHVHVGRFPQQTRQRAEEILQAAARGGVTAVRDLAGDARALGEVRHTIETGELVAPTLIYSALFGGTDIFAEGPTATMAVGYPPGAAPWAQRIERETDLALAVAAARGSGADALKLYGDLSAPLVRRIVAEARRQDLLTIAHATVFPARPSELVQAGVGTLAHAAYLVWEAVDAVPGDYRMRTRGPWDEIAADHPRLLALYRQMAARGTTLDATLYVYEAMQRYAPQVQAAFAPKAFAWGAQATRQAHAAGVRVTTGTDWFEPREGELPHTHEELRLLVTHAGFSPMEAIVAATRNGALALGLGDRSGLVAVGMQADLLVLGADPLADIANTAEIRFTVLRGRLVQPQSRE